MKIKYWLMISYFIVMLLPIIALYGIYVSVNHLNEKQSFVEYVETSNTISEMEAHLHDPTLYTIQPVENYDHLTNLTNDMIHIRLFRADGAILYSSLTDASSYTFENKEQLYKNLNEIKISHRTFTWKQPVFENNELVGIYEIVISRDKWIQGVNDRAAISFILFSVFFLLTYLIVIMLLNRKFHRPLQLLHDRMTRFASGEPLEEITYEKKDEIGKLINHFEQMRIQIEKAQKEIIKQQKEKEFIVASLSHDLKTPLTVVQAYSEALLKNESLTKKEKEEYESILFNKLEYMKNMLDDLVTYNALQNAQIDEKRVVVDGGEFFEMLLYSYGEAAKQKKVHLTVEQKVNNSYSVHVKQMVRVVDNIMSNALRHTEENKQIWLGAFSSETSLPFWVFPTIREKLETWRKGGTIILVQNEGKAIPKEELRTIFTPFVQGEKSRRSGSSGLGLSIAKKIMELHEGKITIFSDEGYGTVVACFLKEEGHENGK